MTVWGSTAGGRSVSHVAAAVEGASLRTLPLVSPVWLLSLINPLAALLAGPPSLEILGETAARARGGESEGRRQRRSLRAASGPGQSSSPTAAAASTPSVHGLPSLSAPSASTTARSHGASNGNASTRSAVLGRAARGNADASGQASPDPSAATRVAAVGGSAADPASAPRSALGETLDRITTSALAAAARLDSGARTPSSGSTEPAPGTGDEPTFSGSDGTGSSFGPLPPPASTASTPAAPLPAAAGLGGSALGELVGRWHQSEALPEPAPMTASRSPFAPLATAVTTGFVEAGRSPDGAADEVSLDQVQLALDELLRREAEQHGLEGGLV